MWKINTYKGERVYYEAELIEMIKNRCKTLESVFDYNKGAVFVAHDILDLIKSYEGER